MNEKDVERLLYERGRALDGPVLPEQVEAQLRADLAAEIQGAPADDPVPFWRRKSILLAAAVVLAFVLGTIFQLSSRPARIEAQVAALESAALIAEHRAIYGLDAARLPDLDRGQNPDVPSAEEVVAYATAAEQQALERALADEAGESAAAWYRVALRPAEDCSAIVLQIDPRGHITQAYPDEAQPGFVPNRFEAGRAYVLPRPSVALTDTPSGPAYDYDRGFLRPRSVDRLNVVLGLRRDPLDASFEAALGRLMSELSPVDEAAAVEKRTVRLVEWLEENGFSVRQLSVLRS